MALEGLKEIRNLALAEYPFDEKANIDALISRLSFNLGQIAGIASGLIAKAGGVE